MTDKFTIQQWNQHHNASCAKARGDCDMAQSRVFSGSAEGHYKEMRRVCPHLEIEHRARSCAEDDGPFDICKLCGKDMD